MSGTRSQRYRLLLAMLLLLGAFLVACDTETATETETESEVETETETEEQAETEAESRPERGMGQGGMGRGMGERMGPNSGMRERHRATIPSAYAGRTSPVDATDASLARGEEIYTTHCETCHGAGGMGDGPAGENLDPLPAPIAHTSQMLGDDYLFWRISEGGSMEPFNSAMPAWKETLAEEERWDVINYIRSLE